MDQLEPSFTRSQARRSGLFFFAPMLVLAGGLAWRLCAPFHFTPVPTHQPARPIAVSFIQHPEPPAPMPHNGSISRQAKALDSLSRMQAIGPVIWSTDTRKFTRGDWLDYVTDMVSSHNRLFCVTDRGVRDQGATLACLDLKTGLILWRVEHIVSNAAPTPDGIVVMQSCDVDYAAREFAMYDFRGRRRWRTLLRDVSPQMECNNLVRSGGFVYAAPTSVGYGGQSYPAPASVYAIGIHTGRAASIYHYEVSDLEPQIFLSSPFLFLAGHNLVRINLRTRRTEKLRELEAGGESVFLSGGQLVVMGPTKREDASSTGNYQLEGIELRTMRVLWRILVPPGCGFFVRDSRLILRLSPGEGDVGSTSEILEEVSLRTGSVLWRHSFYRDVFSLINDPERLVQLAGQFIFVSSSVRGQNYIYVIDSITEKVKQRLSVKTRKSVGSMADAATSTFLDGHQLLIGYLSGRMIAYSLRLG